MRLALVALRPACPLYLRAGRLAHRSTYIVLLVVQQALWVTIIIPKWLVLLRSGLRFEVLLPCCLPPYTLVYRHISIRDGEEAR